MRTVVGEDPDLDKAIFQFIYPFSLERNCQERLRETLLQEGFASFRLGELAFETCFYGPGHRVSHRELERYYLPFACQVLFPGDNDPGSFRRLSRSSGDRAILRVGAADGGLGVPFSVHSIDVVLCPFDTGFLTIRTEIDAAQSITFGQALEFGDRMRHFQDREENAADHRSIIEHDGQTYREIEHYVFGVLVPSLLPFLDRSSMQDTPFEKLPFFMDERLFVIGFCSFPGDTDLTLPQRYRAGRLDGLDAHGRPRIGASHLPYMERYAEHFEYARWAPDTYYITDETCFVCLTRVAPDKALLLADQMYGEYYYGLLLNLFHRIVLLKLSIAYSKVQLERKPERTEELIRDITCFSAKYYFAEIVAQTEGREIFHQLRNVYGNDKLFDDVKITLSDLYKYQETRTSKQAGYLLTILTIYTVVSGIFGMNLVIEDLDGGYNWGFLKGYSLFQWVALSIAFSGLAVAVLLIVGVLWKWGRDFVRRRQ
ncbi:hypothetical protein [Cohnella soli]|uniref:CorA-like Mg2+ transporter protein n=1 Tax=Cohnella soli TaxID=425005 RepID=A0ABW0I1E6_9BACL